MKKSMTMLLALLAAGSMAMTGIAEETAAEAGNAAETELAAAEAGNAAETELAAAETGNAADSSDLVASEDEMTAVEDVVTDDMVPIYAESVEDGTYSIDVLSSSSMFRVTDCQLTVADGTMTAVMTLSGSGYLKLFMGTGLEAVDAQEEDYIPFVLNEDGKQTYEVPVEALDMGINCAAWSRNKEKWYDRVLVFSSASLPQDALDESLFTTAEELGLEDGVYLIDVTLAGGSGKSSVESPTEFTVADGQVTAVVTFSSPHYDYMLVNDEKYERVNTEGNSSFEIPVSGFDWKMPVVADTLAMSVPHEIDYTLYFDSASITPAK